jgi:hypothetical protein
MRPAGQALSSCACDRSLQVQALPVREKSAAKENPQKLAGLRISADCVHRSAAARWGARLAVAWAAELVRKRPEQKAEQKQPRAEPLLDPGLMRRGSGWK